MAKKEFNMEKIQEIARSKDISAANHEGPKYIPKVPDQPKKPIQTTIGIFDTLPQLKQARFFHTNERC